MAVGRRAFSFEADIYVRYNGVIGQVVVDV